MESALSHFDRHEIHRAPARRIPCIRHVRLILLERHRRLLGAVAGVHDQRCAGRNGEPALCHA